LMLFAGCKTKLYELTKNFAIPKAEIGADTLSLTDDAVEGGIKKIDSSMSAFEMLQVGMENFYNAKYAINEYNGGVNMTLAKTIKVDQAVQSTKIRSGLGDADGNNENKATYFADNKSYSTFAKIYEKFVITPDSWNRKAADKGDIKFTKPGKKITEVNKGDTSVSKNDKAGRLGYWFVKDNKFGTKNQYKSLEELVNINSNNPTILWMYELSADKIQRKIDPIYVESEKCWKFAFEFKPMESTEKYREVMLTQLQNNAGMPIENLGFNQLVLEVVMWENGMIRAINVVENYQMKMVLSGIRINSAVVLTATQLFSYNPNEAGYAIADHLAKF
ncbi:MAG: hypothetical protein K2I46_05655, partial [Clostridia bacterium]|nr:hypothetical protein [Clostridia bacterium]